MKNLYFNRLLLFVFVGGLLFFYASPVQAQDKNSYIGLSLGAGIPLGDLSSTDPENDDAGWANAGPVLDISTATMFKGGRFGVALLVRLQTNSLDAQGLADEYATLLPGLDINAETVGWKFGGFLGGGIGSFPISNKTSFDLKIMAGLLSVASPDMKVTATDGTDSFWIKQESASALSSAYLIGGGFKFGLGDNFLLLTNVDFLGSSAEFKNVATISSEGDKDIDTFKQDMKYVNVSIGIALKL